MNKLISAIDALIAGLANNTLNYNWIEADSCNCGLIAQAVTGLTQSSLRLELTELNKEFPDREDHTWKAMTNRICPITGVSENIIFKQLQEAGMTRENIIHLEYLSDPVILKKMRRDRKFIQRIKDLFTRPKKYYTKKQNLILYLTAWKEVLIEKETALVSEKKFPINNLAKIIMEKEKTTAN
jgi:hypothetical protein